MVLILAFIYCIIINVHTLTYDGWTEHTSSELPRSTSFTAVGADPSTNTIWLLGGLVVAALDEKPTGGRQLVSYNYATDTFTDHGANELPGIFYGWSQNYIQFGSILYYADSVNSYINSFNMDTQQISEDVITADQAFNNEQVCMVNIRNDYLVLLGEDSVAQFYEISTQQWLNNVPSLLELRSGASCIYINGRVFAIGGYEYGPSKPNQASIEYLDASESAISNIRNEAWHYNPDSLQHALDSTRCIAVNDDIVLIGGHNSETDIYLDVIYTIDSITGTVSLSGHLAKAVKGSATVFVNDVIYSFGGWTVLTDENTNGLLLKGDGYCCWSGWQTKEITVSPTNVPSETPTKEPTKEPTQTPSQMPSISHSKEPSDTPSFSPSNNPSDIPSNSPVKGPTNPDASTCGEVVSGPYNGEVVSFIVHMPFQGDLKFDASFSDFTVEHMEVAHEATLLAYDSDGDGIIWLYNAAAGDYTFAILSDSVSSGAFSARISCVSSNPTKSPTSHPVAPFVPTPYPTKKPTPQPTLSTNWPSYSPSFVPTYAPFQTPVFISNNTISAVIITERKTTKSITDRNDDQISKENNGLNVWMMIAIFACGLFVSLLVALAVFLFKKKKRRKNTVINNNANMVATQYNQYDPVLVAWFVHTVQLPEYIQTFVENGYDKILLLELIVDKEQLSEMGITKRGHRALILSEIDKLRKMTKKKKKKKRKKKKKKSVVELEAMTVEGPNPNGVIQEEYTEEGAPKPWNQQTDVIQLNTNVYTDTNANFQFQTDANNVKLTVIGDDC